jgi:murein DD-endopeptidase MepM/ murein hydrolase activator NlpD
VTGFDMIQLNGGLTFANLRITQGVGNSTVNTLISTTSGEVLAVLGNVQASELTSGDFITGQATPPTPPLNTESIPLFQKPFSGEFGSANYFDHDLSQKFPGSNNYMLTWEGNRIPIGSPGAATDGHAGYDWSLPQGTPLLAVTDGEVSFAGEKQPYFCPPLNQVTSGGLVVNIKHTAPNSERFESSYVHLSRIDVREGQFVRAGQQIGLSGTTGCSLGPHLHFEVSRLTNTNNGQRVFIDPYGWSGNEPDPWSLHPDGAKSVYLWKEGQAPRLN